MTPLQQQLFDLTKDYVPDELTRLEGDICTLNAAELRQNIKVFTEENEWLANAKPPAGFPNATA